MVDRKKRGLDLSLLDLLFRVTDICVVLFACLFAFYLRHHTFQIPNSYQTALWLSACLSLLIFPKFNLYRFGAMVAFRVQAKKLIFAWGSVLLLLMFFM